MFLPFVVDPTIPAGVSQYRLTGNLHKCLMLHCNFTGERQGEGEASAVAARAHHPDPPAKELDDAPADMQPEPAAAGHVGGRVTRLAELVENDLLVRDVDARAVVPDIHAQETRILRQRDLYPALARIAELGGVREQVEHDLHDAIE